MAAGFNKVYLMGNLTRDVELRHTSGNQPVANLGLAVSRKWRSQDGEMREETTFVDCEAWGKTAETLSKYVSKGRPLFVEGRLKLDQWEKEGQKHSKIRVVIEDFRFIDSKPGGGGGGEEGGGGGYQRSSSTQGSRPAPAAAASQGAMGEDDIPF
jgi:single-strand DNA-binding protein